MPVRYVYDDHHDRRIDVTNTDVRDSVGNPVRFGTSSSGPNLRITIGNPDVLVSGRQEYKISYLLTGALNPFADHDEFYWNVTGNGWEAPIDAAGALVKTPVDTNGPIQRVQCLQGPVGATDPCKTSQIYMPSHTAPEGLPPPETGPQALFESRGILFRGEGMTIVIGL